MLAVEHAAHPGQGGVDLVEGKVVRGPPPARKDHRVFRSHLVQRGNWPQLAQFCFQLGDLAGGEVGHLLSPIALCFSPRELHAELLCLALGADESGYRLRLFGDLRGLRAADGVELARELCDLRLGLPQ
ncbi:hypothetical protein ACFTZM_11005 [Streptomyces hydrogenans]|uniref:hypothetical protein n=1 Tax=Streptomyces hydrogenans TaxID=1873719 RepID=UPI0036320E10